MTQTSSLPSGLTQAEYQQAVDFARLSAQTYDWKDYLVAEAGMKLFSGIDDIRQQGFATPHYREVDRGGSVIDWPGSNGLDYKIFEHSQTGDLVIAFRGTEPLSAVDWVEDVEQAFGQSEQYQQAVSLAREVQAKLDAYNNAHGLMGEQAIQLSFTGHSLGGGLATAAALATGGQAIVFDAAGLSQQTIDANGLDVTKASAVTNFNVQGDFLTDYNGRMDNTTLGSNLLGLVAEQRQYGDVFWLQGVNERADFGGWLVPDSTLVAKQAEAVLNHAWHVYTYQLEHQYFV
ncbi:lipase family protein [Balneatrix alpica]|uniref:Mbeg1-like protein n=1 Tax=Balneatrix alpica TaxID=75684 RepID=A0ABV5ZEF2_9GAMM|nr:Mbeg1-like protein [Balneatrix alpica]